MVVILVDSSGLVVTKYGIGAEPRTGLMVLAVGGGHFGM